mgnify:CR=1 FL=1
MRHMIWPTKNFYEYEIVEHPNRMVEVNLYMKDEVII